MPTLTSLANTRPKPIPRKDLNQAKKDSLSPTFLDLFAGGGGLSEGFVRAGYRPIAHVEMDASACFTLRTRACYHWLKANRGIEPYVSYLKGEISRSALYALVPPEIIDSVINKEIGPETLQDVFEKVDSLRDGGRVNLIVGGPPCQAYSIIGRSRAKENMIGDKRNYLYLQYVKFLERYHPDYFVFENVTGLISAKDKNGNRFFDQMKAEFRASGYETEYRILNAEDYGIPQNRRRIILVGRRGSVSGFYPELEKSKSEVLLGDILKDLESLAADQGDYMRCTVDPSYHEWLDTAGIRSNEIPVTAHQSRPQRTQDLEIYRLVVEHWNATGLRLDYNDLPDRLKTHNNRGSFIDRFKVVASNRTFSHTVVTHAARDGHYYIHPDIAQNRSLTPRELARIQTFPDDYFFEHYSGKPSRTAAYRQIGNAVPVLLAERIARRLLESWE